MALRAATLAVVGSADSLVSLRSTQRSRRPPCGPPQLSNSEKKNGRNSGGNEQRSGKSKRSEREQYKANSLLSDAVLRTVQPGDKSKFIHLMHDRRPPPSVTAHCLTNGKAPTHVQCWRRGRFSTRTLRGVASRLEVGTILAVCWKHRHVTTDNDSPTPQNTERMVWTGRIKSPASQGNPTLVDYGVNGIHPFPPDRTKYLVMEVAGCVQRRSHDVAALKAQLTKPFEKTDVVLHLRSQHSRAAAGTVRGRVTGSVASRKSAESLVIQLDDPSSQALNCSRLTIDCRSKAPRKCVELAHSRTGTTITSGKPFTGRCALELKTPRVAGRSRTGPSVSTAASSKPLHHHHHATNATTTPANRHGCAVAPKRVRKRQLRRYRLRLPSSVAQTLREETPPWVEDVPLVSSARVPDLLLDWLCSNSQQDDSSSRSSSEQSSPIATERHHATEPALPPRTPLVTPVTKRRTISATNGLTVATLNVRTLCAKTRGGMDTLLVILASQMEALGIDVLGLQETRTHGASYFLPNGTHWFTCCDACDGQYGVGALLSRRAYATTTGQTECIVPHRAIRFGLGRLEIVVGYAPIGKRESDRETFFAALNKAAPIAKRFRVILADFNADLDTDSTAALQLDDFLACQGMEVTSRALNDHSPTWYSNDGFTKKTLDYIAAPSSTINAFRGMRVVDPVISSDHKLVLAFFKMKWREAQKPKKKKKNGTSDDPPRDFAPIGYDEEVRERFDAAFLDDYVSPASESPMDRMNAIKKAVEAAGARTLAEKSDGPTLKPSIVAMRQALEELTRDRDDEVLSVLDKRRLVEKGGKEAAKEATKLVDKYVEFLTKKHDPWHAWQHIFAAKKQQLKPKPTTLKLSGLQQHYHKLFCKRMPDNKPQFTPPAQRPWEAANQPAPEISMAEITMEDIRRAASHQKNHKSLGPDGIPPEVLKCGHVQRALLDIFNAALKDPDNIPDTFFHAFLCSLHKKGSIEEATNYRGISLMSTVAKLFHLILLHRIRDALDKWVSPSQNAYRQSRSCQQHIVAAAAMHKLASNHQDYELHMLFVDFSKAFDSVDREAIRATLLWWNIPAKMVDVVMTMLEQHRLHVRYDGDVADPQAAIQPNFGILQGDTLAPFIFILCIDMILLKLDPKLGAIIEKPKDTDYRGRDIDRGSKSRPGTPILRLTDLAYSDDCVLFSNSTADIQKQFDIFQTAAAEIGMSINLGAGKTEEIRINAPEDDPPIHTHAGVSVGQVTGYKYLGTKLGEGWMPDFKRRKGLAWCVIREFSQVWSSMATVDAKYNLFQALVEPILGYAAWTYPRTEVVTAALHGTHSRMLRHCTGHTRATGSTRSIHTELLYVGEHWPSGKSIKSCCLTLPAAVDRQRLAALGHWTRDHFGLAGHDVRRHPVIDVLRFEPTQYTRKPTATCSVHDAFNAALPHEEGRDRFTVKRNVLIAENSLAADRHDWYNRCRQHVRKVDRDVLLPPMVRRLADPDRPYSCVEYNTSKERIENDGVFRERWLTNRTRNSPLGIDRPPKLLTRSRPDGSAPGPRVGDG